MGHVPDALLPVLRTAGSDGEGRHQRPRPRCSPARALQEVSGTGGVQPLRDDGCVVKMTAAPRTRGRHRLRSWRTVSSPSRSPPGRGCTLHRQPRGPRKRHAEVGGARARAGSDIENEPREGPTGARARPSRSLMAAPGQAEHAAARAADAARHAERAADQTDARARDVDRWIRWSIALVLGAVLGLALLMLGLFHDLRGEIVTVHETVPPEQSGAGRR